MPPRRPLITFLDHTKLHVWVAAVTSFALFWLVGGLVGVPAFPGDSISLFTQPGTAVAVVAITLTLVVAIAIGVVLTAVTNRETGWAAGVAGMAALCLRGGPMREEVMGRDGGVWLTLLAEVVVLYAIIAATWFAFQTLTRQSSKPQHVEGEERELGMKLAATATAALFCALIVLLVARDDGPKQTLAAVVIGGVTGGFAAHRFFPTRPTIWYWLAPLLPAVGGYLLGSTSEPMSVTRLPGGYFGPLARVAPLTWAVAPAAVFWGVRISQRKTADAKALAEVEEKQAEQAPATPEPDARSAA